jgi:hypothetical protein
MPHKLQLQMLLPILPAKLPPIHVLHNMNFHTLRVHKKCSMGLTRVNTFPQNAIYFLSLTFLITTSYLKPESIKNRTSVYRLLRIALKTNFWISRFHYCCLPILPALTNAESLIAVHNEFLIIKLGHVITLFSIV